jgi:hypothetical protein
MLSIDTIIRVDPTVVLIKLAPWKLTTDSLR